jgi:hypothetical protein
MGSGTGSCCPLAQTKRGRRWSHPRFLSLSALPDNTAWYDALVLYAIMLGAARGLQAGPALLLERGPTVRYGEQDTVVSLGVACVVSAIFSVAAFTFVGIVVPGRPPGSTMTEGGLRGCGT